MFSVQTIIAVTGPAKAGKTSLATMLCRQFRLPILQHRQIFESLGESEETPFNQTHAKQATALLLALAENQLVCGLSVVLDDPFPKGDKCDGFLLLLKRFPQVKPVTFVLEREGSKLTDAPNIPGMIQLKAGAGIESLHRCAVANLYANLLR